MFDVLECGWWLYCTHSSGGQPSKGVCAHLLEQRPVPLSLEQLEWAAEEAEARGVQRLEDGKPIEYGK